MKRIFVLMFALVICSFTLDIQAQWRTLIEQDGVSLSYFREADINCEEKKTRIYKLTVYLKNNSGYPISFDAQSWVQIPVTNWPGDCNSPFKPSHHFAPLQNWPNNSTVSAVLYMKVPYNSSSMPEPSFFLSSWKRVEKSTNPPSPQWSSWISNTCYKGLSFQYLAKELVNLNYQVHYEFRVRSNYKEAVEFVLSMRDPNGSERFGTKRSIRPGQTIEFTEKMDQNYKLTLNIDKVWFQKDRGKDPSPCDDNKGKEDKDKNNPQDKGKFDNYPSFMPPGEWSLSQSPGCYGGIGYSLRHEGYLKENKGYKWTLSFNNYYNTSVSFYYRMIMKNGDDEASEWLFTSLAPGDRNRGGVISFNGRDITNSEWSRLEVKDVCFAGMNCKTTGCYAACDLQDKVANTNCNNGPAANENTEKEKAEAEKEANFRNENQSLITQIQADINAIPAPESRTPLQSELNNIANSAGSEEDRNAQLRALQTRVNTVTAQVKANIEQFNADKQERKEQISENRDQNKQIRQSQAELSAGYASFLAAIFSMKGRTGPNSVYQGGSTLFTIRTGFQLPLLPVGYTEYKEGTGINRSTGIRFPIQEQAFAEKLSFAPGLFLDMDFQPYFSNNFSIGFNAGAAFGFWPEFNDGATTTTTDYSGNSSTTLLNLKYGVEITAGGKPVKLLASIQMNNQQIITSGSDDYTSENGNYSYEYGVYYDVNQKWKNTWAAAGLRFGNYLKSKTLIDIAFTRYIPTEISGTPTQYSFKSLIQSDSLKVPAGGFIRISKQNGFYIKAEYVANSFVYDEEQQKITSSTKPYFNLTIGRNFQWFGKPFKKKSGN
jgi:hypothetical protein